MSVVASPDPVRLRRRFVRLSLINILSNLTVPLAALVDTAMLGHLREIRFLAGVALAGVLFDYVYWSFGFLRMGTTGTTAQAVGRGDEAEVGLVLWRSLVLALLIGAGLLLLQWPLREAGFALLAGGAGVEAAGRDYFDARIWGAPATLCNFVLLGWFLGREQSRHALAMTVVGNLANVVLNYVFIVRLQLAATGAGLATMASQYLALATAAGIFLAQGVGLPRSWSEVVDRRRLGELFRLNADILVRTLCLVSAFALFLNFSSMLGVALLAANSILHRVLSLAAFVVDGAAFAAESLAGIFRGQRDAAALGRLFRLALGAGVACAGAFLLALFAAPRLALGLLTSHAEVVELTLAYLPWLVPVLLIGSLAYMYDGLLLGLTEGRVLRNSMLLSTLVAFLPPALVAVALGANHLLWAALALFMAARAATLARASARLLREARA